MTFAMIRCRDPHKLQASTKIQVMVGKALRVSGAEGPSLEKSVRVRLRVMSAKVIAKYMMTVLAIYSVG